MVRYPSESSAPAFLYTTAYCPFCIRARGLLSQKGVNFYEVNVGDYPELRPEMVALSRRTTVPQIWIGERHIGGCNELYALEREGKLDAMLKKAGHQGG